MQNLGVSFNLSALGKEDGHGTRCFPKDFKDDPTNNDTQIDYPTNTVTQKMVVRQLHGPVEEL